MSATGAPLDGARVLDLGQYLAGPMCAVRPVEGLGLVIQPFATQVWADGEGLRQTAPAAKPGCDTGALAREVGLDPDALIREGAAASQLGDGYLPA